MKAIPLFIVVALSIVFSACDEQQTERFDTAETIMIDQTDPLPVYPTTPIILEPFQLKDNPWQGISIKIVGVTDKEVNRTETISLPKENEYTGNIALRTARVERFKQELTRCLASFDSVRNLPRSIIFRAVAQQASELAHTSAPHRLLLLYSNLEENSNVNFYEPGTLSLLQHDPAIIRKRLTEGVTLPNLAGVQLWLLYAPTTYKQNNIYMPIAHLYKQVYKEHRAEVHVESQFAQP